jgi:transposase-like protein
MILLCVRWYLTYNLSLRNLGEMMAERDVAIDHAAIHRWVFRTGVPPPLSNTHSTGVHVDQAPETE